MAASILTNTSAMVALQTLRATNSKLADVQGQIATGKAVASAKDNASVFAISKVMESDVSGFKAISDSLSLGASTVSVASNAASQIGEILTDIKAKIVSANQENVDRQKIQDEVVSLRDQIKSIVGAAQFNGLNLLRGGGTIAILSSLDRSSTGIVTASNIDVAKQDLQSTQKAFGVTAVGAAGDLLTVSGATAAAAGGTSDFGFTAGGTVEGASYRVSLTGAATNELGTVQLDFEYVARDGDTELDVSSNIFGQIQDHLTSIGAVNTTVTRDAATGVITITNNDVTVGDDIGTTLTETLDGTAGGGLAALGIIDVSTATGAAAALTEIETLIQTTIGAQAVFGTTENRVGLQNEFMNTLIDSFKTGIGALVDADLEAASARLQALQVQQQLGIQALSIANQQSQNILALFR